MADWLELLSRGLERLGFQVAGRAAACGEARLRLVTSPGRSPLEVRLGREPDPPGWLVAAGLQVRYRGRGPLSPEEARALAALGKLIEGLADRIPPDLGVETVALPAGLPGHEALAWAFPFCSVERAAASGRAPELSEVLVRLTGRCNQACPFCSAPPPLAEPSRAALEALLETVSELAPAATLTLTGGEPTLRDDLPEIAARAAEVASSVKIQTNGVRFDRAGLARRFAPGPRMRFFVSLHAVDERVYDRCTGSRGMLGRALAGARALQSAGHRVVLSCVVGALNLETLVPTVEAIAALLAGPPRPALHLSVTLCPEHRPGAAELLVPYRRLGTALAEAVDRAGELGLEVEPLLGSSHASVPACAIEPRLQRSNPARPHVDLRETGLAGEGRPWVRSPECGRCPAATSCLGVPAAYAARFGLEELDPDRVLGEEG